MPRQTKPQQTKPRQTTPHHTPPRHSPSPTAARLVDRLAARVERARAVDPVADRVADLVGRLPAGAVKDLLSGVPAGHPAHPVLVTVPIGAWCTAAVLDAAGEPRAARRAVGFGAVAALPAVATGLSDWAETTGAERRVGFVHAVVNDVALALYAGSWAARRAGRNRVGVTASTLGLLVVSVGGWLGGHLSYALGVGVDTTAFQEFPSGWTDVGAADELAEGASGVTAAGVPVLLVKRGDHLAALADRCTHRGAPLHEGTVVDGCVECPWHGSRFGIDDGGVTRGPATRPEPTLEVRVRDGRIEVRRSAEERSLRSNPVGV